MEDEIVQYFVVNKDLNMSAGKIAAQVAHIATLTTRDLTICEEDRHFANSFGYTKDEIDWFKKWMYKSMTKIVLEAKQSKLENLINNLQYPVKVFYIKDEGRTEIEPDSLTCIGFVPMPKSKAKEIVGKLQLLK